MTAARPGLGRILGPNQEELLKTERRLLSDLLAALARFGVDPGRQQTLQESIAQLDELFLLVVVGEFNAGKSAVINALLGSRVLEEGVTPTTAEITLVRHGEPRERAAAGSPVRVVTAPLDLLREIHIVDTPGTNAILREHETITRSFVPRSDLVLFVTSADRPFTETERAFLEQIRDWGKKVVLVVNKVDMLEREEEIQQVSAFVADGARRLLGVTPEVFPVSARAALRARQGEPALWERSRFEALERYIRETLDEAGRLRLKLLNPLGVGLRLAGEQLTAVRGQRALLADDLAMLEDVERQLGIYERDMRREFDLRMADVEKVLLEMERRGHDFFDETLRIGRVFDLINTSRIQRAFEQQVVADAPAQIERRVSELIDWLVESDLRQWQAVTAHLADRRRAYRDRIVGDAKAAGFQYDRSRLLDSIGREAQRVVDGYDRSREASALAGGARTAVAAAAAVEAGALGLGAIVTVAATTLAADITGFVTAGAMAVLGFFILPARRRRAKEHMRRRVTELREQLAGALRGQFEEELRRGGARIRESIAPYARFVRAESEKLADAEGTLDAIRGELERLKAAIERT